MPAAAAPGYLSADKPCDQPQGHQPDKHYGSRCEILLKGFQVHFRCSSRFRPGIRIPAQCQGNFYHNLGEIVMPRGSPREEIESAALRLDNVARAVSDREVRNVIIVPERIVNVVA